MDTTRGEPAAPLVRDIRDAMHNRLLIEFSYLRQPRIVQPVELGLHQISGRLTLRGYQIGGRSNSRRPPFWLLFPADLIEGLFVSEQGFTDDPPGCQDKDARIHPVYAAL